MNRFMEWLSALLRWWPVTFYRWVDAGDPQPCPRIGARFWLSWIGWRRVYWYENGWDSLPWRE